ncbi:MFS general substrate transporter [Conidiobolus coronatus NRRL 28638]|uniref:MFS general substrate transporter n=1 Tax=Conidiobolus coronatus (strain ATCC 28846 / CBS 209.66 / NRRL 28638) TaxID=796925 RepID=A0A137NT38_CONC2|nr:MFS general substrate transporter [Conidiobolus coronatus NRRL 28638]|eukprot:KXN65957.1 MFS general substrate transporter [Conidiobolus coronatus NRRL 28638]
MSIKLQDFDSRSNDISPISSNYEANRSPSAYKQKQQTRILYLLSFLATMNRATCIALSTYILSHSLGEVDDKHRSAFESLAIYDIFVSNFASVVWGFVSDRIGRKVVINICLIGSALTMILYGFSTSSKYLAFINALNGVFSFKDILIKTMIGEANDKASRPNAFRYLPIIKIVSGVLGPMITAPFFVSHLNDMDFDKNITSIEGFPYLIPSLIASGISVAAYFLSYHCLSETLTDNRSKSDEPVIVEKLTDQTTTLAKSKKFTIFGLSFSRNSLLILILSSLLSLIYETYSKISQDWLTTDSSKGGLSLKPKHIMVVTPLYPIITGTILMKYPYVVKNFGILKQFKAGFPAVGVLFILSIILTLIAKIGSIFTILSLYAIFYSIQSGISTLRDISFDLLLIESAEISGNLGTLYGISSILSGISSIFSGIILALPYVFKQLSTFSTENNFLFL